MPGNSALDEVYRRSSVMEDRTVSRSHSSFCIMRERQLGFESGDLWEGPGIEQPFKKDSDEADFISRSKIEMCVAARKKQLEEGNTTYQFLDYRGVSGGGSLRSRSRIAQQHYIRIITRLAT